MNRSILITGANGGLGKEAARQLALLDETEKIYLACRNKQKAEKAKADLEKTTGKKIFEIVLMDFTDPSSVKQGINQLDESIDALVLNAGGMGGREPNKKTPSGMNFLSATNLLGHTVLVEELLKENKINKRVVYVSSEAARGIPKMQMHRPALKSNSVDEFASILDGSYFGPKMDMGTAYGHVKYVGTLWTSSLARKYPNVEFVSISPGATKGTAAADDIPPMMKFMFKYVMFPIVMPLRGMVHSLSKGAARYVDALNNPNYRSGEFYASIEGKVTGALVEQGGIFVDLKKPSIQDNANEALHRFLN